MFLNFMPKNYVLCIEDGKRTFQTSKQGRHIRLLPQNQSDLGLRCLSMSFWQASSGRNFRTSTVFCHRIFSKKRTSDNSD